VLLNNKEGKKMKHKFKHIFAFVLIVGFVILTQGCGTDPDFWYALADGINSGLSGGSSSSSSSSYSGSSSGSSSYKTYLVTLINDSSVTVTVYGEGYKYTIPPNSYRTHRSQNEYIDWDYEPSYLDVYYNSFYGALTFSD
jgi:hypothetical protein